MVLSTLEIVPPRATVWRSRPWEVVTAQPALQLGSGAGVCRRIGAQRARLRTVAVLRWLRWRWLCRRACTCAVCVVEMVGVAPAGPRGRGALPLPRTAACIGCFREFLPPHPPRLVEHSFGRRAVRAAWILVLDGVWFGGCGSCVCPRCVHLLSCVCRRGPGVRRRCWGCVLLVLAPRLGGPFLRSRRWCTRSVVCVRVVCACFPHAIMILML